MQLCASRFLTVAVLYLATEPLASASGPNVLEPQHQGQLHLPRRIRLARNNSEVRQTHGCARRSVTAYGYRKRRRAGRVVHLGAGLHHRCQFPLRGRQARRRTRSRLFAVPCRRPLRWLFDNSVEGHLDRAAMRRGHSSILPHRHVRQCLRLHETAPRRGERDLQGSDGVYGLPRRRPILSYGISR